MQIPETFQHDPYAIARFEAIVDHARRNNPFYARWIGDGERIPIVDRETFLDHNEEILNGYPVTDHTSGSTGMPVRISRSRERMVIDARDTDRFVHQLGGELPCTRIIYPNTDERPPWLMDINSRIATQIEFILQRHEHAGAVAITTFPTNAEMLADAVLEQGIDMSFIRRFGVYAEMFESQQESLVRQAFPNAQIWSTYSSMEFGLIAPRCIHEPRFHHIMTHKLGVEVLNVRDEPSEYDEIGRLVVTDYFNRNSPLIRYEIGDLVARGKCPCGTSHLPAFGQVLGKTRGALMHRNGQLVVFADLSVALRDIKGMRQYQVIQEELDRFVVRIVSERNLDAEIHQVFETHFGSLPYIAIRYEEKTIPRESNGKFHASICRIPS